MTSYVDGISRNSSAPTSLWEFGHFQPGDWLDQNASPEYPEKALTDNYPVANPFLIKTL
ncbi:uncharacterized protein BKA55DRAFT_692793 [Fusarium redolens]|uniref:Uncharacterized protein n=1 Tax=Fusarium redolens TaxID=48865 RepID=A0A9P9GRU5_FUSRE|nr:uncharacterized protein BKA55DRAFT_692793 [Fusarium redolens]KAH7243632.1 hypothetical protein BKA55DRAFT_692793 [Fusarium redolens]